MMLIMMVSGEWKNSKFEGKGTYTWKGNSEYIAEWEYGLHKANGDLADIVSEMKDVNIDVQSEEEVLSYLKENYG